MKREKIAVVGLGAAGLTTAYLLQCNYDLTLYEKNDFLGGHACTIIVKDTDGVNIPLDVGFMVFNNVTYPTLHKLLSQLEGVEIGDSEMSFSYSSDIDSTLQYTINWNPNNEFAREINLIKSSLKSPKNNKTFLHLLKYILKFRKQASKDLEQGNLKNLSLGQYLSYKQFSDTLIDLYILPMGAAIWSSAPKYMLEFPAENFIRFFSNHGLLSLEKGPQWQYIKGGSHNYVKAMKKNFQGDINLNTPIDCIVREKDGVIIKTKNGKIQKFDYVVIGTHADEALKILADPSEEEQILLGAWKYQINNAFLHTDESVMPSDRNYWASWNYKQESKDNSCLSVTYHLNRLQRHKTDKQYFVTLNSQKQISPEHIIRELKFTHPLYDFEAIESQLKLASLNGKKRTYFCGNYFGYGFHEDAVKSGASVAKTFGVEL